MKKIIFIGIFMFLAGNIFCQTITPMDKNQQKTVKQIHKDVQKQHNDILKQPTMSADEKKDRVEASKSQRDAKLSEFLTYDQVVAVKLKDPIDWAGAHKKIEKQEKSRLKAERDVKLKEVDKEVRVLDGQQDALKKQMNDLKREQKNLDEQQKALKQRKKEINAQYK